MSNKQTLSLEFFPPRDIAAQEKLVRTAKSLMGLNPAYVSMTFGAGGSTRAGTVDAVALLQKLGFDVAPHLSCIGTAPAQLKEMLDNYRDQGIRRIVALRGDLPSGMGGDAGELRYASDLVSFIRENYGEHFHIEVAAYPEVHPQARNFEDDLRNFKRKVDAGANSAITQYFFNADSYFYFVERAEKMGVTIPLVPGIMPITNYSKLARFSDACGAEIPRWIRKQLEAYGDDLQSIQAFGEQVVSEMCERLLQGGAPGLNFYTLNQAEPSLAIWNNLKLPR